MTDFADTRPDVNPFAPPKALLTEPTDPLQGPAYAGRGRRLAAAMLDSLILMVFMLATLFSIRGGFRSFAPVPGSTGFLVSIMSSRLGVACAVVVALQAWFFHIGGQTMGKKLLGIRIVRTDGRRAGLARLLIARAGSTMVMGLIPILGSVLSLVDSVMIFRASHQCLHDKIADTIVVTAESSTGATLEATRAGQATLVRT